MDLHLKGKKVLVTGSSKGIGYSIARCFLGEGASVVITARTPDRLKRAAKDLLVYQEDGAKVLSQVCDFTDLMSVKALSQKVLDEFGGLDILVANVGSGKSVPDAIPPLDQFMSVFSTNYLSAYLSALEFVPMLKQSKGSLLFVSSIAGLEAIGAPVDYSVSKSSVMAFSKAISRKLAGDGIRVNCIAPGNIYFKGGTWDRKMKEDPGGVKKMLETHVPMGILGNPEDIGHAAIFLSSEKASFITGAVLTVDGGQTVSFP